jgi:putative transposase
VPPLLPVLPPPQRSDDLATASGSCRPPVSTQPAVRPPRPPKPPPPRRSRRSPVDRHVRRHAARLAEANRQAPQSPRRPASRPLGPDGQQPRRRREQDARKRAVAFARWARRRSLPQPHAAWLLGLSPRTLGRWDRQWNADHLAPHPLGRPRRLAGPLRCLQVLHCIHDAGPTLGLPALRAQFPLLARSQLVELQQAGRDRWLEDHAIFADTLQWLVPGSVWATDFSHSPVPIDVDTRDVLAVRDLASHNQLLLLPTPRADALTAAGALEHLFTACGPPLVLKDDNGSPFIAEIFEHILARWGVIQLLSPKYYPQYNGSTEAGFGPSKTRIFFEAARHGRFDHWISDDAEAARLLANCASRPWGSAGPTPQQAWDARPPIPPLQRQAFGQSVADHTRIVRLELGLAPDQPLDRTARATVAREAVGRALEGLGYLQRRRRRITPPFKLSFSAIFS